MTVFEVIEAKPQHCGQMMRIMRIEHQSALARIGVNGHKELRESFDGSCMRRAWLIDGQLAGLGGVVGTLISPIGYIWLSLSNEAMKHPVQIVKEARRQLDEIMMVKRELATTILPEDKSALRFAIFLGFHVSHDEAPAINRQGRAFLFRTIENSPQYRIEFGDKYLVKMGYHYDEAA